MLYPSDKFIRGLEVVKVNYPVDKTGRKMKLISFTLKLFDRKWRFIRLTSFYSTPQLHILARKKLGRKVPDQNILEHYSESELRASYCFGREKIARIVALVENEIAPQTNRSFSVHFRHQPSLNCTEMSRHRKLFATYWRYCRCN